MTRSDNSSQGRNNLFADALLKAHWLQRDAALKAFVDQRLHIAVEGGNFRKISAARFG